MIIQRNHVLICKNSKGFGSGQAFSPLAHETTCMHTIYQQVCLLSLSVMKCFVICNCMRNSKLKVIQRKAMNCDEHENMEDLGHL